MKKIELTKNKVALVDDEDYEFLNRWKWYAAKGGQTYYARRNTQYSDGKQHTLFMHRLLMMPAPEQEVDHKDRDGLNNQKANLRVCTHRENTARSMRKNKTSYRGVEKHGNKWRASINSYKKRIYLGSYHTPEEAATAFNKAAIERYGEFACLNKVMTHNKKHRR